MINSPTAIHCCLCQKPVGWVYKEETPNPPEALIYCYLCACSIHDVARELEILSLSADRYPTSSVEKHDTSPDIAHRSRFKSTFNKIKAQLETKRKRALDLPD